ncbi:hypothetical protein MMC12_003721 [Toensbergia leucococca]|nr:hypothetical protein [Toensbergia leucococca]
MTTRKSKRKPQLLSHTRPKSIQKRKLPSLPSHATRTLIRTHHTLQKQLSSANALNDTALVDSVKSRIDALGGLETYQQASIQGQSSSRGGDSSRVLMDWLSHLTCHAARISTPLSPNSSFPGTSRKLRMLEVGALRTDNAHSRSGIFDVTRIDLHSQDPGILEQDFMERPVPALDVIEESGFDVVSLSLVVNYVGDAARRGEMLKRVGRFLRCSTRLQEKEGKGEFFPGLFLVLPASCLANSRYLDEERLQGIMQSLGFTIVRRKLSAKVVYYFWRFDRQKETQGKIFRKEEVRPGKMRNNFAIVLR